MASNHVLIENPTASTALKLWRFLRFLAFLSNLHHKLKIFKPSYHLFLSTQTLASLFPSLSVLVFEHEAFQWRRRLRVSVVAIEGEAELKKKARVSRTFSILWHVHQNDAKAFWKLLEEDSTLVHTRDYDNHTPLHDWIEVAKCLIDHGANVNAQDRWKNTIKKKEKKTLLLFLRQFLLLSFFFFLFFVVLISDFSTLFV